MKLSSPWVPTCILIFMILCVILMAISRARSADLPADPVQRVAAKALAGDFGVLTDWQRQGYTKLLYLDGEPEKKLAWITCYSEFDPGCNRTTASGREVSMRVAAMLDVPFATWVLVSLPEGYQLRQVMDRGSRANQGRAEQRGATVWCDLYYPYRSLRSWIRPIYLF